MVQEVPPAVRCLTAGDRRRRWNRIHFVLEDIAAEVARLRAQHQAGRRLTDRITQLANAQTLKDPSSAKAIVEAMEQFVRMYEPHEAREDTVLFPALRSILSKHEFDTLGEEFETKEHQLFGEEGFDKIVDQVAGIDKRLGIYDLAQFTPARLIASWYNALPNPRRVVERRGEPGITRPADAARNEGFALSITVSARRLFHN